MGGGEGEAGNLGGGEGVGWEEVGGGEGEEGGIARHLLNIH